MEENKRSSILFIYNPFAGKGRIRAKLPEIVDAFSNAGYEVIVYPTKAKLDAAEKAYLYAKEHYCDRIVCAGGDGTLAEVASGVLRSGNNIPLGFISAGTTNDFASSLQIPDQIVKAAELAVTGTPLASDIAVINGQSFIYSAAFGLFTDVTYDTSQIAKNAIGRLAYFLNGAGKLINVKSYHLKLTADGVQIEDDFIDGLIVNSDSVGGFKGITGKDVIFDDGYFEMIFIKMPKNLLDLNSIINCLYTGELENSPNIYYKKIKELTIETDGELIWTFDGEYGGDIRKAKIEVLKQRMTYITGIH